MHPPSAPDSNASSRRQLAAFVSLGGGIVIFAAKLLGWQLTGSTAVLSDALESTVNVVAATFAVAALRFAAKPADRDHPYGHGKIEFISAAFEGGLISFAAVMILYTAGKSLLVGPELKKLDLGLAITAGAGVANLLLGAWILRQGKKTRSATLIADGQHILSDVWTTGGVILGLFLVRITGIVWLDPIAALSVGVLLGKTGVGLVRESVGALLDREDPELLQRLVEAFNEAPQVGITGVHRLRAIRSGDLVHVDAHVFVPEHWSVLQAHSAISELEDWVKERSGLVGELALHLDPCHERVCEGCGLPACPIRRDTFGGRHLLTVEQAVGPANLPPHPHRHAKRGP